MSETISRRDFLQGLSILAFIGPLTSQVLLNSIVNLEDLEYQEVISELRSKIITLEELESENYSIFHIITTNEITYKAKGKIKKTRDYSSIFTLKEISSACLLSPLLAIRVTRGKSKNKLRLNLAIAIADPYNYLILKDDIGCTQFRKLEIMTVKKMRELAIKKGKRSIARLMEHILKVIEGS